MEDQHTDGGEQDVESLTDEELKAELKRIEGIPHATRPKERWLALAAEGNRRDVLVRFAQIADSVEEHLGRIWEKKDEHQARQVLFASILRVLPAALPPARLMEVYGMFAVALNYVEVFIAPVGEEEVLAAHEMLTALEDAGEPALGLIHALGFRDAAVHAEMFFRSAEGTSEGDLPRGFVLLEAEIRRRSVAICGPMLTEVPPAS